MPRYRNILLVADDPKITPLLVSALRLKGYDVVLRDNAPEALTYLRLNIPDLILADMDRAQADGLAFLRRVRETTRAAYAPFILMVSTWDPQHSEAGQFANVEAYLRKPFTVDELLVRVESVFARLERSRTAAPRHDLEGRLGVVPLIEVLGIIERRELTGKMTFTMPADPVEGTLMAVDGEVLHAAFGRLAGVQAVLQLDLRSEGAFAFNGNPELVIPEITVRQPLAPVLRQAEEMARLGRLRRIDVTNRDACRLFMALLGDVGPDAEDADEGPRITDRVAGRFSGGEVAESLDEPPDGPGGRRGRAAARVDLDAEHPGAISSGELEFEAEEGPPTMSMYAPSETLFPDDDPFSPSGEVSGRVSGDDDDPLTTSSIVIPAGSPGPWDETQLMETPSDDDPADRDSMDRDSEESAVALVDDGPGPVEMIFHALAEAWDRGDLGEDVVEIQMSTISGRPLASTVPEQRRREEIAEFTARSIQFARGSDRGRYAQLSAGELQLIVMELPQRRLLTCLFDKPLEAEPFLDRVWTVLESVEA